MSDDAPVLSQNFGLADFDAAVESLLAEEGGLVDHPSDPGGITHHGISLRWLKKVQPEADADTIRSLTRNDAIALYREHWWDPYHYASLRDQRLASKVLSLSVNTGPKRAHTLLQRALVAIHSPVQIDGILGPVTLHAARMGANYGLVPALRSEAAGFYRTLVARDNSRSVFLKGWLRRAYA